MEDIKTHSIETSAVADPTDERADILEYRTRSAAIISKECD